MVFSLVQKNKFVFLFLLFFLFFNLIIFVRFSFSTTKYVYVKVRLGQGLWWVNARPNYWFLPALKKGEEERGLLGSPRAEILSVRYYTWNGPSLYDIYLTVRLKASYNKTTKKYFYKRWQVAVGSPIDFEFPKAQVSGTVMDLSEKPFKEKYVTKIVTLIKTSAYSKTNPYPYKNIKIGDKYFDGEDIIFEVLDKKLKKNLWFVTDDQAIIHERNVYFTQDIILKAKIKVKIEGNKLVFAQDQIIHPGAQLKIVTDNYAYIFNVIKIESP